MRQQTVNIYQYAELSDKAKEHARDWYRSASDGDTDFEFALSDFIDAAKACGLFIAGTNPNNPHDRGIYYSIGGGQGDGAAFTAQWYASDVNVAETIADWPAEFVDSEGKAQHSKSNARLRCVLEGFAALAALDNTATGRTQGNSRYLMQGDTDYLGNMTSGREDAERGERLKELCSDLADWLYRALEAEYEYQNSDEAIAETIEANEYEFLENGERA